jgi:predicted porin
MKKTLVAMAVLAASGAAMAQSNVQIYGLMDLWLGSSKLKTSVDGVRESTSTSRLDSGGVATSRIGFKGTEDLGGGLKANFQLEQGFNADNGTQQANGFNRQSWVGLSGGFGAVQLGRVWTSYDDIRSTAKDTFSANISSEDAAWLAYTDRTSNGIKYTTPEVGGFSGSLTYALGEDKTPTNGSSSLVSLGVQYANGPVFVGFSHQAERAKGKNGTFSALPGAFGGDVAKISGLLANAANFRGKTTYNLLNGSYDFGVAKAIAGYNTTKIDAEADPDSVKATEYMLGVEVPITGAMAFGAGYSQSKVKYAGESVFKTTGYSMALLYNMSKRTSLYAALTQTKLKDSTSSDNLKANLYAVGLKHAF